MIIPNTYRSGKSVIETFAIVTADSINEDNNCKTAFYESPEIIFYRYSFNYYEMKGNYGEEDTFLIYNPTLSDAKSLSTHFNQRCFIFGQNTDEKLIFELWAKKKENSNDFSIINRISIDNETNVKDEELSQVLRDLKIRIPMYKFEFNDDEIMRKLYSRYFTEDIYRKNFEHNLEESLNEGLTFMGRVSYRERIFRRKI